VTSDTVTSIAESYGDVGGKVVAAAAIVPGGTAVLPIVDLTAVARTPVDARNLANQYAAALAEYVEREQIVNEVPARQRVAVESLNRASPAELAVPRSRTLPVIVLLAVLSATFGLAFALENLRSGPPTAGASGVRDLELPRSRTSERLPGRTGSGAG
jgi:hypothetical protein